MKYVDYLARRDHTSTYIMMIFFDSILATIHHLTWINGIIFCHILNMVYKIIF